MSYIKNLQKGLRDILSDPHSYLIGEDIAEPYGGAFKVSKGLSLEYPNQVIATPMSEQGFTGMGVGMALAGLNVIVEIMFGDFITLCADQLINHASKFVGLYDKEIHFVLRAPMGGYRGYGATHSQSIEKLFMGYPDIYVVAPSVLHEPGILLKNAIEIGKPVLFAENKLDYSRYLFAETEAASNCEISQIEDKFPIVKVSIEEGTESDIVIVSYGGLVADALALQEKLYFSEEIVTHVISPSMIYPVQPVFIKQIMNYKDIFIVEEGYSGANWGSEVTSHLKNNQCTGNLMCISASLRTIGAAEILENSVLPDLKDVYTRILELERG